MNFVLFSTALWDWSEGVQPAPQLARELARRGHHVLFVQPRRPTSASGSPLIRIVGLADLGLPETQVERAWNGLRVESLQGVAENLVRTLGEHEAQGGDQMAIWFAPFEPFARLLPPVRACGYHAIYYPQDDFGAMISLGFHRASAQAESYLMAEAETIVALSQTVAAKMRGSGKKVEVIPDGISLEEFRPVRTGSIASTRVLRGERTLGFWGFLSESMVDAAALAFVARERPTWSINLIGTCDPQAIRIQSLQELPNIRFCGQVPHSYLCKYGESFDACLLPAPDNDFSRGRDPLKVYEYLAVYKPVVCTNMPQLEGMPSLRNASNEEEFLGEIEEAMATPVDRRAVDAFLSEQTWEARTETLLKLFTRLTRTTLPRVPLQESSASSRALPSFQLPDVGMDAYLASLEKDLQQAREWSRELEQQIGAQDRELERFYNLLPVRLALAARRWLGKL